MKPGYRTTEFWLAVVTGVLAAVKGYIVPNLPNEAIYAVVAYILSRGIAKHGNGG